MELELPEELRPLGPGRYATWVRGPWGQAIAAEMLVATREGWADRPEAGDPRWAAFAVGPTVVAFRLLGDLEAEAPAAAGPSRGRVVRA
jgi:hypothetical protein